MAELGGGHLGPLLPGQQQQQQFLPAFAGGAGPGLAGGGAARPAPLPKQLTAAIKGCASLDRLAQLYHAHQGVLNPIHIAAMITKLPKLDTSSMHGAAAAAAGADLPWVLSSASAQQAQLRGLLQHLLGRLKLQGCGDYSPRGVANIIWALAKLQCAPDAELRGMLLEKFCSQLGSAVPQDVSNVLWGVAKLTKERAGLLTSAPFGGGASLGSAPAVLQPGAPGGALGSPGSPAGSLSLGSSAISAQEWGGGGGYGSTPGEGTSLAAAGACGGAAALAPAPGAPLLQQEQVRLLLQHLCQQLPSASVQTISNSLWAVVVLQQEHQWCMCSCLPEVQTLLTAFCEPPQQALPGHIQPVIRCMAQLATTCSSHAGDGWLAWQPRLLQRLLQYLGGQREQMELHHVSSVLRDVAQIMCLHLLLAKQLREKQRCHQGGGGGGGEGRELVHISCTSSSSSLPAVGSEQGGAAEAPGAGSSAASTTSSCSSTPAAAPAPAGEDEAEEVLARLAASGGPQDASSTVVALSMLRPQLEQLGLAAGVAALCSLLPPAALPQLAQDVSQRLLSAASSPAPSGGAPGLASLQLAGRVFPGTPGDDVGSVGVPAAVPGSSSSNSSGSNVVVSPSGTPGGGSFTGTSPLAGSSHVGDLATGAPVLGDCGGPHGCADSAAAPLQPACQPLQAPLRPPMSLASGEQPGAAVQQLAQLQLQQPSPTPTPGGSSHGNSDDTLPGVRGGGGAPVPAADSHEEAAARQLTHNIAYADSVYQLAEIFTAHSSVMDMIHITACITRLSKVLGSSPSPASQAAAAALLPMLGSKLLEVLPHANARGIANVLWGYGRLRNLPQTSLLPPLLEAFLGQLHAAACRDSAVVLWSLARLTEGQGGHDAVGVSSQLLQRLGRSVLAQLAAAAQVAAEGGQPQAARGGSLAGQPSAADAASAALPAGGGRHAGKSEHDSDASAAPSSRDISNSLMALTRLGFMSDAEPEEPAAAAATAPQASPAEPQAGAAQAQEAEARAAAVAAGLQGLALQQPAQSQPEPAAPRGEGQPAAGGAEQAAQRSPVAGAAPAAAVRLTLPLRHIQAVVSYLLQHAASAKTLDLQEAATALKQLGLRDLQSLVAAAIVAHHGSAHIGAPHGPGAGALHFLHLPGGGGGYQQHAMYGAQHGLGRPQLAGGRPGTHSPLAGGVGLGGAQFAGLLQGQQRRPQALPVSGGPAYGAAWLPVGSAPGTMQVQQPGLLLGGMPGQQPQQYLLQPSLAMQGGVRRPPMGVLDAGGGAMYAGSPGAGGPDTLAAAGYAGMQQFGQQPRGQRAEQQPWGMMRLATPPQQQQPAQQMMVAVPGPGGSVQYMLLPQQQAQAQHHGGGAQYILQQQAAAPGQQEQLLGMLQGGQPQAAVSAAPGAQFYVLPSASAALAMPGGGGGGGGGGDWMSAAQPQLMLQPMGAGGEGQLVGQAGQQYGAAAAAAAGGMYQPQPATSAMLVGDSFLADVAGAGYVDADALVRQQQQQQQHAQQQGARPPLQGFPQQPVFPQQPAQQAQQQQMYALPAGQQQGPHMVLDPSQGFF